MSKKKRIEELERRLADLESAFLRLEGQEETGGLKWREAPERTGVDGWFWFRRDDGVEFIEWCCANATTEHKYVTHIAGPIPEPEG